MSLQEFIPPIDIPTFLHLPIVHFAIAFLIVVILLEIINLLFQKRALSVFSLLIIVLFASVMGLAYLSVGIDGKEIVMLVTDAGKPKLDEYKNFGIYLGYGALALIIIKLLFMTVSNILTRIFFVFILLCVLVLSGLQIKNGTLLQQEYGIDSKATDIIKGKNELQNRYNELEERFNELSKTSESNETAEKLKELQDKYDSLLKSSETTTKKESTDEQKESIDTPKSEVEEVEDIEKKETPFDSNDTPETKVEKEVEAKTETTQEHKDEEKPTEGSSSSAISLDIPSDSN